METIPQQDIDRFLARVEYAGECWLWQGHLTNGYGRFGFQKKMYKAHRFAYLAFVGTIPPGLDVLHKCDTPNCVRPEHLFVGTHADNMRDMASKGRSHWQQRPEDVPRGDRHRTHIAPHLAPRGERNGQAKLTAEQVETIRQLLQTEHNYTKIGRQFSVTRGAIRRIANGRGWQNLQ